MRSLALVLLAFAGASVALTPKNPPYGALSVKGSKLVGANGQNVQLAGMSLYWSQVGTGLNRLVVRTSNGTGSSKLPYYGRVITADAGSNVEPYCIRPCAKEMPWIAPAASRAVQI